MISLNCHRGLYCSRDFRFGILITVKYTPRSLVWKGPAQLPVSAAPTASERAQAAPLQSPDVAQISNRTRRKRNSATRGSHEDLRTAEEAVRGGYKGSQKLAGSPARRKLDLPDERDYFRKPETTRVEESVVGVTSLDSW
jgi:hypothetical protein